jgi:hypothetical protein
MVTRRRAGHRPDRNIGRGRLRTGRILAAGLGVLAIAVLALSGCGPDPAPAAHRARPGGGHRADAVTFCARQPAPELTAALARTVRQSLRAEVLPLGISADGRMAYVSTWSAGFSGVGELNLASGTLRRIQSFADPGTDQADGSAGGNWLVWEETYSLQSLDDFTVYAYDSVTGVLRRIGHSLAGPGGTAWPSPWHAPAVSGHYAAWAQGYGPGGLVEIRLANLTTGRVTVIREGHTQPPFFDGHLVVWPESDRPGTQTTLHAFSLPTGRPASLPTVLRAVHGTEFVATDGTRTAYFSPDLTRIYYSPAQDRRAVQVLRLPAGQDFADLDMEPGTLAWTTTRATYLASTRTGAYSQVTPRYGYATGLGPVLLISDAPAQKTTRPILPLHAVDPGAVTWPGCYPLDAGQAGSGAVGLRPWAG